MGNPIPTEPPEIDPVKWYCVHVLVYQDTSEKLGCEQDLADKMCCVRPGQSIMDFHLYECSEAPYELCIFSGYSSQRIHETEGPFDTYQEAVDNSPCIGY